MIGKQLFISILIIKAIALILVNSVSAGDVRFVRNTQAYIVASPETELEKKALAWLNAYVEAVTYSKPQVVSAVAHVPKNNPAIILANSKVKLPFKPEVPQGSDEAYALVTKDRFVVAAGRTDKGLKRAIQRLIMDSRQEENALVIPHTDLKEKPWIENREWTICSWTPENVRGVFHNPMVDRRLNIYRFSDERLTSYVEMFDWLGFSGCQLMETCNNYSNFGSIEAAQAWQRKVASNCKVNGQQVSIWAWTAIFNGFGWYDNEVIYEPAKGLTAYEDPRVRQSFEKYYDYYARLAPLADRFIMHFYDPGHLKNHQDVFSYMRLLEKKLKAANPKMIMGIDMWASGSEYFQQLVDNGFSHYLILPVAWPEAYREISRDELHQKAKELGLDLGIWGWYITEYETDQAASMYVNARLMSKFYKEMRAGALAIHPVNYWSEMEAHHINNIYTMYASSQLLWNPDRDPDKVLEEITSAIWGTKNGQMMKQALDLIQDVRTGPSWDTYWWTLPTHRIGTDDPESDLRRAEQALKEMLTMKIDSNFIPKLPLPYEPAELTQLIVPHIKQIRDYSLFHCKINDIRKAAVEGASKESLTKMLADAWVPVPEYNTWTGTFGNFEINQQKKTIESLAAELGIEVKDPATLRYAEADRIFQIVKNRQRALSSPYLFTPYQAASEFRYSWSKKNIEDRFQKLIDDGVVEKAGEGTYRITEWKNLAPINP